MLSLIDDKIFFTREERVNEFLVGEDKIRKLMYYIRTYIHVCTYVNVLEISFSLYRANPGINV